MKVINRSILALFVLALCSSTVKAVTLIPNKLRIINNYSQPIQAQIFAVGGRIDPVTIPAKSEYLHTWHWGWYDVAKFRVTHAPGSGYEKGTEKWIEIVIPKESQSTPLRPHIFTFNAPDDYSYKSSVFGL